MEFCISITTLGSRQHPMPTKTLVGKAWLRLCSRKMSQLNRAFFLVYTWLRQHVGTSVVTLTHNENIMFFIALLGYQQDGVIRRTGGTGLCFSHRLLEGSRMPQTTSMSSWSRQRCNCANTNHIIATSLLKNSPGQVKSLLEKTLKIVHFSH